MVGDSFFQLVSSMAHTYLGPKSVSGAAHSRRGLYSCPGTLTLAPSKLAEAEHRAAAVNAAESLGPEVTRVSCYVCSLPERVSLSARLVLTGTLRQTPKAEGHVDGRRPPPQNRGSLQSSEVGSPLSPQADRCCPTQENPPQHFSSGLAGSPGQ